jgi:AcrR family transcriptional regulator
MNKKADQSAVTRQAIVQGATRLFATKGFSATSIEAVLEECGISRGALYHHFTNKEALFEASFEALEARIVQKFVMLAGAGGDPIDVLHAGCAAWIDLAQNPEIRQMAFIDAPSVLGWEKWREIESRYGFGLLKAGLVAANTEGAIPQALIDSFSHMLLAALNEVGMMVARAADQAAATTLGKSAVRELLSGILKNGPPLERRAR